MALLQLLTLPSMGCFFIGASSLVYEYGLLWAFLNFSIHMAAAVNFLVLLFLLPSLLDHFGPRRDTIKTTV